MDATAATVNNEKLNYTLRMYFDPTTPVHELWGTPYVKGSQRDHLVEVQEFVDLMLPLDEGFDFPFKHYTTLAAMVSDKCNLFVLPPTLNSAKRWVKLADFGRYKALAQYLNAKCDFEIYPGQRGTVKDALANLFERMRKTQIPAVAHIGNKLNESLETAFTMAEIGQYDGEGKPLLQQDLASFYQ